MMADLLRALSKAGSQASQYNSSQESFHSFVSAEPLP